MRRVDFEGGKRAVISTSIETTDVPTRLSRDIALRIIRRPLPSATLASIVLWLAAGCLLQAQEAIVRRVPAVSMPREVDSNSPAFWRDGRLFWFGSNGGPWVSSGPSQFGPWETRTVPIETANAFPHWLESVVPDDDGVLYGWYHGEPIGLLPDSLLTAPRMGAVVSTDGGATLRDLGIVLESGEPLNPAARNGYFAGGHGDGTVIHDRQRTYFYFFFGNYGGAPETQGVCLARMAYEDRAKPDGKVWKYHNGSWREAGRGGRVTPIFPVRRAWGLADPDAYWGPSVHWNTYLNCFVMLLNRASGEPGWSQEGVYVSFCADLSRPETWTTPRKILDRAEFPGWYFFYPQVMGLESGGTDRRAGQVARLYVSGISKWEIEFVAPAIAPASLALSVSPSATVQSGAPFSISATGVGQPPFSYQWLKDGVAIPGATTATFTLAATTTADTGSYSVVVSNTLGATRSDSVTLTVSAPPPPPEPPPRPLAYLSNFSVFSYVADPTAVITLGYKVRATVPKPILIRALGPALASIGVAGGVANPRLDLFDGTGIRIAGNDDWLAGDAEAFAAAGAFALPEASADAAVAIAVPAGSGTASTHVTTTGYVLAELYDPAPTRDSRIDNVSARARVGGGSRAMVGGIAVAGTGTARVLIRALGPHLALFGVAQPLSDPVLEVYDQNNTKIAENDDWDPALAPIFRGAGVTALPEGSQDAALVATVTAGRSYTIEVRRGDGVSGDALIEIHVLR